MADTERSQKPPTQAGPTPVVGIYGGHNAGKTTLIEKILDALLPEGYRVAVLKHSGGEHRLEPTLADTDGDGTDTQRLRAAGAALVGFHSAVESAFVLPRPMSFSTAHAVVDACGAFDLVLVEGWKHITIPKIAVGDIDAREGTVLRYEGDLSPVLDYLRSLLASGATGGPGDAGAVAEDGY